MRTGRRMGIDVGTARIGVAVCDAHGLVATPVETIMRATRGHQDVDRIIELLEEFSAVEIVVGHPIALSGRTTSSTADALRFAQQISHAWVGPVRLVDERLSTVSAHAQLRTSGRSQKMSRSVIDQAAAVVILQQAIDTERQTGTPPGQLITAIAGGTKP